MFFMLPWLAFNVSSPCYSCDANQIDSSNRKEFKSSGSRSAFQGLCSYFLEQSSSNK